MTSSALSFVSSLAAIGAALGSLVAAAIGYILLRRSTDPDVIVYMEQDPAEPRLLYIVIENVGNGIALNIDFRLSRELKHPRYMFRRKLVGAFVAGIPTLPPAGKRRYMWGDFRSVMDEMGDRRIVCDVTFSGRLYFTPIEKRFANTCILEAESYRDSVDRCIETDWELRREIEKLRGAIIGFGPIIRSLEGIKSELADIRRRG